MLLKEIFRKKEVPYDPVTDPFPINPEQRAKSIDDYKNAGDPMPKPELPKEEIIFKLPGIRLVRTTRAK